MESAVDQVRVLCQVKGVELAEGLDLGEVRRFAKVAEERLILGH